MSKYEIIDHGWDNNQYFQGCSAVFTDFDSVVTGCGNNAKEAYGDAVDSIYQRENTKAVEKLKLPKRPYGIRATDKVPARSEDCYWYVSIRYTL